MFAASLQLKVPMEDLDAMLLAGCVTFCESDHLYLKLLSKSYTNAVLQSFALSREIRSCILKLDCQIRASARLQAAA